MKMIYNLIQIKNRYCPNWNYWEDVTPICEDRIIMYCDCKKCNWKIYKLQPKDITKKMPHDFIEQCIKYSKYNKIKQMINLDNMYKIEKLLI